MARPTNTLLAQHRIIQNRDITDERSGCQTPGGNPQNISERNDIVNITGQDSLYEKESLEVNHQTNQEYSKRSVDISPEEKLIFNVSVEEIIKYQGIQEKMWLQQVKLTWDMAESHETSTLSQLKRDLENWILTCNQQEKPYKRE